MSARAVSLAAAAALALVLTGIATMLVLASDHEDNKAATIALAVTAGISFIASGLVALWRRPENRTGYLLAAVGYLWFFGALNESNNDWLFTVGMALGSLVFGAFIHLLLAFPDGRLTGRRDLWLVVGTYALVLIGSVATLLLEEVPNPTSCPGCRSTIAIGSNDELESVLTIIVTAIALALLATVLVIVVTRYRRSTGALRRALGPVLGAGAIAMLVLALELSIDSYSEGAARPLEYVFLAAFAMVPLAFLAGVLRSRLARAGVGELLLELGRGMPIREAIAGALADPTLEIAYWLPEQESYVTADGKALPEKPDGRGVTVVEHAGLPTAALLHDPMLADEPELIDAVAAAAGLWLDNERLQAKLRAQIEFLEAIVNASPSLLCSLNREGRIANLNDAAWQASGYIEENDVKRRPFWEVFVGPEERDEWRRQFEEAPAHEATSFEHTFVNQRGERLTIAWSTAPLYDDDGGVRYVVCGGLDITERERQHRQLQASEERLRAAIQASPVAIIEVGLDDCVAMWNPAAERMFGWSEEEMLGAPVRHVPPERREELQGLFDRVRGGEVYKGIESTRVCKDGSVIDVEISAAPIHDDHGRVAGHLALFADISERKRQEEELRASRARIVEAGDSARRRLERNLHDGAQQRLVALSLSLRLAQSKVSTDPATAEAVLDGARTELAAALDELRELARGIHPAVLTDRGLAAAIETLAARSPVPVEFEAPVEKLPSSVDAAAYYVIAEALANVIKYADATEVNVRVARDDGRAVVTVSDDGVGGADPAGGSGLSGLADRVEALGGNLTVESRPGEGTCVTAIIPLQHA